MSTHAKHTPGPWKCQQFERGHALGEHRQWGVWDGASFPTIARVTGPERGIPWKQAEANARLIAAAPELLAALQALAHSVGRTGYATHSQACATELANRQRYLKNANAAIAKARGGAA